MCETCGKERFAGRSRPPVTATMRELAELIKEHDKDYSLTHGGLHIVIDDWNVETVHIEWCRDNQNLTVTEHGIARIMLGMTEDERCVVLELANA